MHASECGVLLTHRHEGCGKAKQLSRRFLDDGEVDVVHQLPLAHAESRHQARAVLQGHSDEPFVPTVDVKLFDVMMVGVGVEIGVGV